MLHKPVQQVAQGTSASLYTPPAPLLCLSGCIPHPGKVMKATKNLMTTACCPSPERGLGPCICYLKFENPVLDACRRAAINSSPQSLESSPCSQHMRGRMSGVLLDSTGQSAESLSHPARKGKYSLSPCPWAVFLSREVGEASQAAFLKLLSPLRCDFIKDQQYCSNCSTFPFLLVRGRLMEIWVTCLQGPIITTRALSVSDI